MNGGVMRRVEMSYGMPESVLAVALAICLAINLFPTVKVLRGSELSSQQKLVRLGVIWLIPLLGGLAMSLFYVIGPVHSLGTYDVGTDYTTYNDGGDGGDGG